MQVLLQLTVARLKGLRDASAASAHSGKRLNGLRDASAAPTHIGKRLKDKEMQDL